MNAWLNFFEVKQTQIQILSPPLTYLYDFLKLLSVSESQVPQL